MQIHCPNCRVPINSKVLKPGRYTPKCPKCAEPFVLVVPADPGQTVFVRKVPVPEASAATVDRTQAVADPGATGDFGGAAGEATQEVTGEYRAPRPGYDRTTPQATGVFDDTSEAEATGDFADRTDALPSDAAGDIDATTAPGEAASPSRSKPKKAAAAEHAQLPEQLGGYALSKQLGAGGMGAVYLARQVSLDRDVALKVMHANFAADPVFLARFTREAYAAAQLNHHNVVQIYDIGADEGVSYFSMEFVEGKSLGQVLQKSRKLDPAVAVGYVIQAARGLKYAHDRGMVHRDIKPDNLMLNTEGIVKVADLGLVKTRGMTATDDAASPPVGAASPGGGAGQSKLQSVSADVTSAGTAMGSPSYMAPEQCRDAATVDLRADVYSLGCTLYAMLAGRTPFVGKSAVEVIRKHLDEAPPPLDAVEPGLPKGLTAVVAKTLAKDPADRYQTMEEFVAALKGLQETSKAGPPRATEEQVQVFESMARNLAADGLAKLGRTLAVALPLAGLAAGTILLFLRSSVGGGVLAATLSGVACGAVASGLVADSHLARKAREWVFGARVVDWLTAVLAGVLALAAVYFAGLLVPALIGVVAGGLVGVAFAFGVTRAVAAKRARARDDFNAILKRLRLAGMDEDAVREFVVLTADQDWELVYETVYGYPAKLAKRAELAAKGEARPTFAAWRDPLVARFEAAAESRAHAKARRHLQKVEQKRLVAEGVSAGEAAAQSRDAAEDLVEQGAVIKAANRDPAKSVDVRAMLTRYELAKLRDSKRPRRNPLAVLVRRAVGLAFSVQLRVVLGALLIVGGLLLARQNQAALAGVEALAGGVGEVESAKQAKQQAVSILQVLGHAKTQPLSVPVLPPAVTNVFDSFNPVVAGALLVLSALFSGTPAVLLTVVGAVVALGGHKFGVVPDAEPLRASHLTALAGLALAGVALVLFGRGRSG